MAKKKEIAEIEPVIEDVATEEPVEVKPVEVQSSTKATDVDAFINRKLQVINNMSDPAKAKALAERVLRNRKGK